MSVAQHNDTKIAAFINSKLRKKRVRVWSVAYKLDVSACGQIFNGRTGRVAARLTLRRESARENPECVGCCRVGMDGIVGQISKTCISKDVVGVVTYEC